MRFTDDYSTAFFRLVKHWKPVIIGFLYIILAIVVYRNVWQGYFQQDEWSGFGRIISAQREGFSTLFRFSGLHFTPLSIILVSVFFTRFGLNHVPYGWYSVLLHGVNTFLVYALAKKVSRQEAPAHLAAIVFLTAYTPYQTITWYAASLSFLPSAFFALLSLVLFESYLEKKKRRLLIASLLCVALGATFRENTAIVLIYFPIRSFIVRHTMHVTVFWSSLIGAVFYLSFRFAPLLFSSSLTATAVHADHFGIAEIVSQGLTFLMYYLPRLLVPAPLALRLGHFIFGSLSDFADNSILHIFYAGVWIVLIVSFLIFRKTITYRPIQRNILLSFFVFLLLSFLPLSFIPQPFILESRHYYLSSIGYSILAGFTLYFLYRNELSNIKPLIFFFLFFTVSTNIMLIRQEIRRYLPLNETRIIIIKKLTEMYPILPDKTIFYAEGDPLPFQSGIGQMLMVLFSDRQDFTPFMKGYYLWNLKEQGYKETNGKGFGYFTDISTLKTAYCQYRLSAENVFTFSWDENHDTLRDTSRQSRRFLTCTH